MFGQSVVGEGKEKLDCLFVILYFSILKIEESIKEVKAYIIQNWHVHKFLY